MKKLSNLLPLLLWVTVTWSTISLESTDITTIWGGFTGAITSMFGVLIDLAPYLITFAVGLLIFWMIKRWIKLKK